MHIKYGCRTCTIMHCGSLLANSGLRVNLAPEISLRLGVNVATTYFTNCRVTVVDGNIMLADSHFAVMVPTAAISHRPNNQRWYCVP